MKFNLKLISLFISIVFFVCQNGKASNGNSIDIQSLNGLWEMGFSRNYTQTVRVPGIPNDPTKMADVALWYKKEIDKLKLINCIDVVL
jgi:hypothetical protein